MENTNNVDVSVDCLEFRIFPSNSRECPQNFLMIYMRNAVRMFSHDPEATPQLVQLFPINARLAIPQVVFESPLLLESFFRNLLLSTNPSLDLDDLENSQIDFLASELANYMRDEVIPQLHSSGESNSFHLIMNMTVIRDYPPIDQEVEEEEEQEVEEEEEQEIEEEEEGGTEHGSSVSIFVLERLRELSFPYEEKERGGSWPMKKIGVGHECSICLQEFCDAKNVNKLITCLPCGHAFHQECIFRWFEDEDSCPYCRHRVESV